MAIIEIRLKSMSQLFDSLDPAPFHDKALDREVDAYLVESVDEYPAREPLTLLVRGPETMRGNLAEIIGNISWLIRERFKLKGRIQVLSAEGRMAAWVLCLLPFGVAAVIQLVNPGYLGLLFTDPMGRIMSYGVGGLIVMGILVIRKMVRIEV